MTEKRERERRDEMGLEEVERWNSVLPPGDEIKRNEEPAQDRSCGALILDLIFKWERVGAGRAPALFLVFFYESANGVERPSPALTRENLPSACLLARLNWKNMNFFVVAGEYFVAPPLLNTTAAFPPALL